MNDILNESETGETNNEANFAYLGSPRAPESYEYVPQATIPQPRKPMARPPIFSNFKLSSLTNNFKEHTNISYIGHTALALFVGISIMSFLTQGFLSLKDLAFGNTYESKSTQDRGVQNINDELVKNGQNGEALGSDDSTADTESDTTSENLNKIGKRVQVTPFTGEKQYSLENVKALPKLTSRAYLAADLETGEIIVEQNQDLVAPIASVSKLMTAVVAKENMDMQKIAIVSRDSYNTYGAQGELTLGEKIKVYDLMYPLLIESSNDAAEVIADAYEKGHEAFLALMNKKAAELGMSNTYYEDPSGLNPKNVSSIEDLLKLGRYIFVNHPELYNMTRVRQYSILKHTWANQNRFLNYDTFLGGKNGFIDEAKKTTVSLFDVNMAKGGKRAVVIVLLKSDDREGDAVKIINLLKKSAEFSVATSTQ